MVRSFFRKNPAAVIVGLCTVSLFLVQYVFRGHDDNRLTSWKWAFADSDVFWCVPLIIIGTAFMYALLGSPIVRQRPLLFLFLSSFSICAIFWRVPEVIVDSSRYFTQAKHVELYGAGRFFSEWGRDIHAWTDLPLIPFLYGMIFRIFGETRAFIQIYTSVVFSLTVVVTCLIGQTLWDRDTGLLGGALLWGIPYIFSQTPLMLVDIHSMFFLTLSVYSFMQALQKGGPWIIAASLSIFCAVFSKYSNWMMLTVIGVVFLVYIRQGTEHRQQNAEPGIRKVLYRGVTVILISGVLAGIFFVLKSEVILSQVRFLREYQAPGLRRWGESFVSTFLYQVHPFITIAAFYSVYEAVRKRDVKFLILFWLLFLIVVLQIRRSRYVMAAFPMLTLMASYGLQRIRTVEVRRCITAGALSVSMIVSMGVYLPFLQSMSMVNFRDAADFLNTVNGKKVQVFTVPSDTSGVNISIAVPILDLFTWKDISYEYDGASPTYKGIETSPLRFTWEYKNPDYYSQEVQQGLSAAVVVISNRDVRDMPELIRDKLKGHQKVESFDATTGLFRFSPVVSVYLPVTEEQIGE